ncbi:ribosome-associated heat shock protein Hsp15 [Altererythrobacter atlanticus]|uniref:RNA-binding S4 domain-containing protein n=1 Tax=Croceibacterium atlanticum TaxID=1267766 RepID=UPI0009E97E06|nr:S4 domain-containing protein [Croceibacterium atlanticum]MBB5731943.1 ribosome-associated heat shock protein Hsp15 [Croceibacterium atlanticum]
MRIDRLLCLLRFAKTRGAAQRWIAHGHMRLNGQRITSQDRAVSVGDVLTLPLGRHVRVIEIIALPHRRGPASEAQACYRALDAGGSIAIAGAVNRRAGQLEGRGQEGKAHQ